ncbi:hypothetical protein [Ktedonobacter sp. SOSP1-52]|uniref:hypothetical protein n=1 Tax=Ktedonobacter sp. SOSP1-52 TaxID=2778366 RepID=UPI0019165373|nr:hypothetical protein [Ktedonobacter sp. SOSP1-52]
MAFVISTTFPHKSLIIRPSFTQAICLYRPILGAIQAYERTLPNDLATVLTILFPTGQTWIPTSDWF